MAEHRCCSSNYETAAMSKVTKPKVIGFDLDYTLWPFWVDTHVDPPFHKDKMGRVLDRSNKKVKHYDEVPKVLQWLHSEGFVLAVVSRTGEITGANQLLKLFEWDKYFTYKEIYPGCKINHFERIKTKSGAEFNEMLFFDDEHRNKRDLDTIGVWTVMVEDGITKKLVKNGLEQFSKKS